MKVVITSKENNINSLVDPRFGRAAFFAVYDTDTDSIEWLGNDVVDMQHGAGTGAVNLLANLGAKKIFAVAFGAKVKPLLDELDIQMVIVKEDQTVSNIITLLKK